jgi:predicted glycoside hydrolase/deacetylase ChbG (UPF0249 family)
MDLRLLIVNADDFGYCRGVNRGIIEAHERGIVTSASLMVKREAAADAADYARGRPQLAVGLHVELRRRRLQRRLSSPERLRWLVANEVAEQLERFRALMGRDPTHLDSHHHSHREPSLAPTFRAVADDLRVPLRHLESRVRFCGDFYGHDGIGRPDPDSITPAALVAVLEALPEGVTELGCHPGYADGLDTWYREERAQEVSSLCDPAVRGAIDRLRIELISFRDLAERSDGEPAGVNGRSVRS